MILSFPTLGCLPPSISGPSDRLSDPKNQAGHTHLGLWLRRLADAPVSSVRGG